MDGASAFNTRTARGRLFLLDPARGEDKLRESSGSTTAWWWSLRFSGRASPSTTEEEEEVLGRERAAPGEGCGSPPTSPPFIGAREMGAGPLHMDLEGGRGRLAPQAKGGAPFRVSPQTLGAWALGGGAHPT